jgi:hypothetical protein
VKVKRPGSPGKSGGVWLGALITDMEILTPIIPPSVSGLPGICDSRAKWFSAFQLECLSVRRGALGGPGPDLWYALRVVEGGFCF